MYTISSNGELGSFTILLRIKARGVAKKTFKVRLCKNVIHMFSEQEINTGDAQENAQIAEEQQNGDQPIIDEPQQTIAEALGTHEEPVKEEPDTVSLSKFLDEKKGRKAAEKRIKELEQQLAAGDTTQVEAADDIEAIADEFGLDDTGKYYLSKVFAAAERRAEAKAAVAAEAKTKEALKPLTEKERQDQIDTAFTRHFNAAMEQLPELADVVNPSVIKQLSLLPQNASKTFRQIIEETYGNAVSGRRTLEPNKPGGGKEPEPLDIDRARKDPDYFKQVMANPKLKAEYNKAMLERGI